MSPQFPLSSEPEYLRASVLDAALTLGPNVTNLIFADSIFENPPDSDKEAKLLYIPDLYSLSPSAAAGPFSAFSHDTDISSSSNGAGSSGSGHDESSPSKSRPRRVPPREPLESAFVVVPRTGESPDIDITPEQLSGTTPKKGIKHFTFLSRKQQHAASNENSLERGRPTISNPRRLHPALDDPVRPIMISMPTPRAPSRSEGSTNSTQSTPTKLRKRIQLGADDISVSTGKSSSSRVLVKSSKKKGQDEDSGYVSEGSGLSSLKSKARRKGKYSTSPPPDRRLQSATPQRKSSTETQSSAPVQLPIAERFGRKKQSIPQPLKIPQIRLPPPTTSDTADNVNNANGNNNNISLPNSSFLVVGSTSQFPKPKNSPISDKSFVMVPDLNIMKRLGLDKYVSEINATSGAVGSNNEIKLQVMEMLLKNSKDSRSPELTKKISEHSILSVTEVGKTESIPAVNVVPPRSTTPSPSPEPNPNPNPNQIVYPPADYPYLSPPTPIIRGKDSPFPKTPIRGKEPPFPSKPILRPAMTMTMTMAGRTTSPSSPTRNSPSPLLTTPAPAPGPLRFKLPSPDRYKNIDLPRSVRSSYEKDLEREEEEAPSSSISDRVKARRAVTVAHGNGNGNGNRHRKDEYDYDVDMGVDSPSIYSSYFESEVGDSIPGRRHMI